MAAAFLRRTVATAGLAVLATMVSPLGTAMAADPLSTGTFSPANGDTVAANRPPISVAYNTALSTTGTTIAVTDTSANNAAVPCARSFTPDAATVGCTLTSDLTDGHAYKVTVHAVNAADANNKRDETATWTIDIPSLVVASPADGSTVAVAQTLAATYDEQIDSSHSTVSVVNGFGSPVRGSTAVAKSSATGDCPTAACVLKFTASQTLPAGSYTATFHADGVTAGVPSASDNPNAFATNVVHFVVNKIKPSIAPQNVVAPAHITQANVDKVPFSGYAQPGFNVAVAIYDEACDSDCEPPGFGDTEGHGLQDGFATTTVANCVDADAISKNGLRLCPFNLTVDDSAGCDTGTPESFCNGGDPDATTAADNQWYAYAFSGAGALPAAASPSTDAHIDRDTSAPSAPDGNAHGSLSNAAKPNATLTVAATDSGDTPDAYVVRVADQFGDSKDYGPFAPTGSTPLQSKFNKDITIAPGDRLYDGSLTVSIATADSLGNVSDFVPVTADPGANFNKEVVDLAPVAPSSHADLLTSSNGTSYDFANLPPTATPAKVGIPSAITVHFNEPVVYPGPADNSGNGTPQARLCILDPGGLCENAGQPLTNPQNDRTALKWAAPAGFGADLPSGNYTIAAFAPAASCSTRQPIVTYNCETSGGIENDPTTWQTLATFTVDKSAPAISAFTVSPTTITPSTVKSVTINGTSAPDTRSVQISIKSSGGGSTRVLSEDVPAPADSGATSVSWTFFPVDLSTVRDGTLTISAIAVDDAGNKTAAPGSQVVATLAAHASTLTEMASNSRITYGQITQVSGRLVDQSGKGISKATVLVRPRFGDGSYGSSAKAVTDSTGHWGAIVAPAHNATWYASYAGSTTGTLHDAALVHTARTLVKVAIRFISPKNRAKVGSPVVLKGLVSPNKRGAIVTIYRHTSSRNVRLGRVTLSRRSAWAFQLALPRGTFKVFAVIGRTSGNLGNRTGYLTITH